MNYRLSDIARITESEFKGSDHTVRNIITDSRSVIKTLEASVFIAIKGRYHDGHNYIGEMYAKGIRAFILEHEPDIPAYADAGFIISANGLATLQTLAAEHRRNFRGTVIAVTGSNGKTIVKEWIAQLCPKDLKIFRSPRSYNSQLGVPLSILMLEGDEDFAVIEAGISETEEMAVLEKIIRPDTGIITNIGTAHLENFKSAEHLAEEKLILFKNAKTIIYNTDHRYIHKIIAAQYGDKRIFTTGRTGTLSYRFSEEGELTMNYGSKRYSIIPGITDSISIENIISAIAVYFSVGINPEAILSNVGNLMPVVMRMELIQGIHGSKLINDSYNSDINSLSASLDYLGTIAGEDKKIVILSDILDSGTDSATLYKEVETLLGYKQIDRLIGIGANISSQQHVFNRGKEFYESTDEFIRKINKSLFAGCAVLIKGSRPFGFEKITHALEYKIHSTTLEVDLDAMVYNLNHYRSKLREDVKVMAMVKAFSYGSGSFEVASMLQHQGVDYLAVAFADEGVILREAGITMPVVVLNADSWSFAAMIENSLEPEIYSFLSLEMFIGELRRYGEIGYPIHIKIDTGMHRLGFEEKDTDKLIEILSTHEEITVSTVFTHFAVSESADHDEFTLHQIELFQKTADKIKNSFKDRKILSHASNSSAIERFGSAHLDMVRLGIGLYGISATEQEHLKNVSTLKSRIVQIKKLGVGETVGYGRRGTIHRESVIATIPIGYADGLDRRLGNGAWKVYVNGIPAPTIGNVCMDTCMIDITGIPANEGDEVIIFGSLPHVSAMAATLGTIPYEILTSVSPRVKRIYIKE
ncbi:MAG: bifunctional UDP-N-acetylmuramoyl-tripeptide:D-alanyl-D-alanine ligase/alanine racemase [Rikenellaceae bacterium]|nr:bifunctional UDP-N-acetylmuramoyl-tripeptide:D-alanyl-D-alanine ligase/alanine racemase [Rikenellaceae bacterium]